MSNLGKKLRRWTRDEIDRLHRMHARGATRREMASALDMEDDKIRQRLQWEAQSDTIRASRRKARNERIAETRCTPRVHLELVTAGPKPAAITLIDRDLRYAAPPRDLTAVLCGDPPVGFSALERRI